MYNLHSSHQPNVGGIYQYIYFFPDKIQSSYRTKTADNKLKSKNVRYPLICKWHQSLTRARSLVWIRRRVTQKVMRKPSEPKTQGSNPCGSAIYTNLQ